MDHFHNNSQKQHLQYLPSGCIVTLLVMDTCGPVGVEGDLSVFPGGVATVVGVVGVPLPPTIVSVNITGLSVLVCLVHI